MLFKIDPVPFELDVQAAAANLATLNAKLLTAQANQRTLGEQLKEATGQVQALDCPVGPRARCGCSSTRSSPTPARAASSTSSRRRPRSSSSKVSAPRPSPVKQQVREKLAAKTPEGEQDEVAQVKAQIAQAEAQLATPNGISTRPFTTHRPTARWFLWRCVPARWPRMLVMHPVMTFVEDEQWILAIYHQNEVRKIAPGQEAEVAFAMYPGRVVKLQGGLDHVGHGGGAVADWRRSASPPVWPRSRRTALAVRLLVDPREQGLFLASGAHGAGAVYTDSGHAIHILRKIIVRIGAKLDWLILKLH